MITYRSSHPKVFCKKVVHKIHRKTSFIIKLQAQASDLINPTQDGEASKKVPATSFSPVTSTNVEISPQNFLTFSFNLFATLV